MKGFETFGHDRIAKRHSELVDFDQIESARLLAVLTCPQESISILLKYESPEWAMTRSAGPRSLHRL